MTTAKRLSAIGALALTIALGGASSAQEVAPADPGDTHTVEVTFGGYSFDLLTDEPVQACVLSREDALDGVSLTYRLFVREPSGEFSSVGVYPSPALGAFANAERSDCLSLDGATDAN